MRPTHLLLASSTLLASACNELNISIPLVTEGFVQTPFEKVDVLLVVDNSCSMEPYQEKLASDFGGFFDFFEAGEVDYHLAVAHTDGSAFDHGRIRGPIVTSESPDPEALFAEVVNVGTTGGGIEAGLAAAEGVLRNQRDGFPRDDASISVVFVSDEQDSSPGSVASYVNSYFDLRGARQRNAFNASALTVDGIADCTPEQFAASAPGTRYQEAARLTGGIVANLCVDDFEDIVLDLALTTSTMLDTFFLKDRPDLSTLRLWVSEEERDCADGTWRYEMLEREGVLTPAIVFPAEFLPLPSEDILVEYERGTGDPADFCQQAPPASESTL
jgi:hypothetical protein